VQGVEAAGKVVEVAKVATGDGEMGVVTFHVGVVIPKPDSQLRPGMTANVEIKTEDVPDALVVPASAISEGTDGSSVEVLVDEETGETETRMIEVGVRNSSEAVVTDGLFEGETVVYTEDMGYEYE
jgi:multidrug efflux pump subunit AcrA (membrane-fusion protein)